jgi:hypothetical protein
VSHFIDVDENKIGTAYNHHTGASIPIVHFSEARAPFVVLVALDRTGGQLEQNVASLGLQEGVDYFHFS